MGTGMIREHMVFTGRVQGVWKKKVFLSGIKGPGRMEPKEEKVC